MQGQDRDEEAASHPIMGWGPMVARRDMSAF
jgi:hypothetical protein